MTIDEYKLWIKTRGPVGKWKHSDCRAADELIKREATKAFSKWLEKNVENKELRDWVSTVASVNFGSADVDDLFMSLKIYPDWIE